MHKHCQLTLARFVTTVSIGYSYCCCIVTHPPDLLHVWSEFGSDSVRARMRVFVELKWC